jgi:hypothetical protein
MIGYIGGLLMNKLFILLSIFIIVVNYSGNVESINDNLKDSKKIELKIDLTDEKKLQTEVDNGHQPWRLEPIDVAYVALSNIDKNVIYEDCHLIYEKDIEAKVKCKNSKNYLVYLKKLIRPDGIWTAISIEVIITE